MTVLRPIDPAAPRYRVTVTRLPKDLGKPDRAEPRVPPGPWPPIDFPVFGLDRSWTGPRWLDGVFGSIGESAPGISLAHGDRPGPARGHPWMLVATWRPSGLPWASHVDVALEHELARSGLLRLMNTVTPYLEDPDQRSRYRRNALPYLLTRTIRCESWAATKWMIDSKPATARFARLAGGWTGWAFELDRFAVTVVACGVSPHEIRLRMLTSASGYHFDLDAPISHPQTANESRAAALGPLASDYTEPRLHSDIRKLIYNEHLKLPPGYTVA